MPLCTFQLATTTSEGTGTGAYDARAATPAIRTSPKVTSMHWLLVYDLVDDYIERRAPLRDDHLKLVQDAHDRGEILLAGALADAVDKAVLVFAGDDPAVARRFAEADPYVREGLVSSWRVRSWNVVVGLGLKRT